MEIQEEKVADEIILYDIKDSWDELWDAYSNLFDCPINMSTGNLEKVGITFDIDNENTSLGMVHAIKDTGVPFKITFNKIIDGFKQKYYYSVIIHEMCHFATIVSDYSKKTYDPEKYESCNGHTQDWLDRANKFNKLTNKKNEKLFEIVPYLNKDVPIISMIDESILNDEDS